MKRRYWSILIALVLVNYLLFSCAFTQMAKQRNAARLALRTPLPTFEHVEQNPVAWIVLPTSTPMPSRTPITPTATEIIMVAAQITPTVTILATETAVPATPLPTVTPTPATVQHEVQAGETLGEIAKAYNVTVEAIVEANNLSDPDQLSVGELGPGPLVTIVPQYIPPFRTEPVVQSFCHAALNLVLHLHLHDVNIEGRDGLGPDDPAIIVVLLHSRCCKTRRPDAIRPHDHRLLGPRFV